MVQAGRNEIELLEHNQSGSKSSGSGSSASRTVDGDVVQTAYGPIQVDITVKDGKITAIDKTVKPATSAEDMAAMLKQLGTEEKKK